MQSTEITANAVLVSIVLALTVTAGVASAAGTLSTSDQTVAVDEQTQVAVTLDDAPDGVQRYNVTVRLENGDVGTIESASAGDVGAFQVRSQADDYITFRAADLSQNVQDGASDVTLGAITITATNPGTSKLTVTVHDFRTDDSEQMNPSVTAGTLTAENDGTSGVDQPGGSRGVSLQRLTALLPGSPPMWAAGGSAIVLLLLVVLFRRRRTEKTESGQR